MIDDTLVGAGDGLAEHHNEDGQLAVRSATMQDQDSQTITDWTGSWNAEGTAFHLEIPGPIDPTRIYFVKYFTVPSTHVDGATFANTADVNGIKLEDKEVWNVTGGGTGDGDATGAFTVTKAMSGSGAPTVPADSVYTVRYSYGDPVVERTVAITAGATSPLITLPAGTVVTLVELTPARDRRHRLGNTRVLGHRCAGASRRWGADHGRRRCDSLGDPHQLRDRDAAGHSADDTADDTAARGLSAEGAAPHGRIVAGDHGRRCPRWGAVGRRIGAPARNRPHPARSRSCSEAGSTQLIVERAGSWSMRFATRLSG